MQEFYKTQKLIFQIHHWQNIKQERLENISISFLSHSCIAVAFVIVDRIENATLRNCSGVTLIFPIVIPLLIFI